MPNTCTDVVIHIVEELDDANINAIERELSNVDGVVSACVNEKAVISSWSTTILPTSTPASCCTRSNTADCTPSWWACNTQTRRPTQQGPAGPFSCRPSLRNDTNPSHETVSLRQFP